jgi:hypothetical protein
MTMRRVLPMLTGLAPLVAMFAAFFILPDPHSRVPAAVVFASAYTCAGALLLGFFGSLTLAVRRRRPAWLIVTVATVAAAGASFSIAFEGFSPGH